MLAARPHVPALLILACLTILPSTASARDADSTSTRTGRFFWRGRPLPECRSFLITELGLHRRLNKSSEPWRDGEYFLTVDLGYMRNRSERHAVGGLVHFGTGGEFTGFGPAARYRRWFSDDIAADVTVGLDILGSTDGGGEMGAPAPWLEVGFSAADILTISLRGEHWTRSVVLYVPPGMEASKGVTTWYVGAKGGSYLGAVGTLGLVALIAVVIAAYAGST